MWGILTSIDLFNCDPELIRSPLDIKKYVKELIELIGMKAYGDCQVVHFGSCKEVEGFTMVQMIETSLISGHFVNISHDAYIDIFSCKEYDSVKAGVFSAAFFRSSGECNIVRTVRGNKSI